VLTVGVKDHVFVLTREERDLGATDAITVSQSVLACAP